MDISEFNIFSGCFLTDISLFDNCSDTEESSTPDIFGSITRPEPPIIL